MHKKYCLDTSVFVHDPNCMEVFKDNDLIIPIAVLEELDHLKTRSDNVGANARKSIRKLDVYFQGDVSNGVDIGNNIRLFIDVKNTKSEKFDSGSKDDSILSCCLANDGAIIVSKDINMRLRAKAFGIEAQDYENDKLKNIEELYTGHREITLTEHLEGFSYEGLKDTNDTVFEELYPNECVRVLCNSTSYLFRKVGTALKPIRNLEAWGVKSRSKEQAYLFDMLMDPNLPLVTIAGPAGTGKTLIATGVGLELCLNTKQYKNLKLFKPVTSIPGQELGYLPGPQPLDAKILTPNGWTEMGKLKEGDFVIGRNGKPTKVLGVFPKGKKMVYRVTTTDGSTECCADHLWYTETYKDKQSKKRGQVKNTKELIESLVTDDGKLNHYLPRNEAVEFKKTKLPLPPYLLGVILGDGSTISKTRVYNTDQEIIDRVEKELAPMEYKLHKLGKMTYDIVSVHQAYRPGRAVKITNLETGEVTNCRSIAMAANILKLDDSSVWRRCDEKIIVNNIFCEFAEESPRYTNKIREALSTLGLVNVICYDKFVPEIYKYSAKEDRIDLLRGLMDTDGTIKESGEASFCTTSHQLALDLIEIVKSLGGRAVLRKRDSVGYKNQVNGIDIMCNRWLYEFTISMPENINPFYVSRKANRHKCSYIQPVKIKSIEPVEEKEVQCILVEDSEHLYITDDFIVTHNTMEEKIRPFMGSFYDSLEVLFKEGDIDKILFQYKDRVQFEPLTYIRGRSMTNSFLLIDEVQNLSKNDVKTIITRIGNGTKVVLLGDYNQIDVNYLDISNNGLSHLIEKFKYYDLAGHVTLQKCERSSLSSLAGEIL